MTYGQTYGCTYGRTKLVVKSLSRLKTTSRPGRYYLQSCGLMGGERRDFIVSAVESVRKLCGAIQYTHLSVADI